MRKIKSDRKIQKFENLLGEFYCKWVIAEQHTEEIEKMTNKEMRGKVQDLKIAVEIVYSKLRADEKYMYYVNLYYLYEMLCNYFQKDNLVALKRNMQPEKYEGIEKQFGYEPVFSKELNRKADDVLHWLSCSIFKILHKYSVCVRDNKSLSKCIEDKIIRIPLTIIKKTKIYGEEFRYLNLMLSRLKYAKAHTDIIYSLDECRKEDDKKTRSMVKSSLTRVEKLLNIILNDVQDKDIVEAA